jgi:hypothetical protein
MTWSQREPNIGVECRTPPKRKLRQLPERSLPVFVYLRRRLISLVGTTGNDLERVIRQWPLQRLRLIPWRAHPDVTLLIGRQDHRHRLRMDRLDDLVWRIISKAIEQMRYRDHISLRAAIPLLVEDGSPSLRL